MKPRLFSLAIALAAGLSLPAVAQEETFSFGNWMVEVDADPMTDVERVFSVIRATEADVGLMVRCADGELDILISWDDYLGDDFIKEVQHRFPPGDIQTAMWSVATNKTATFLPDSSITGFVRHLVASDRLVVRTIPYAKGPITGVFELNGAVEAVGRAVNSCGVYR